jgi:hypothetical protein
MSNSVVEENETHFTPSTFSPLSLTVMRRFSDTHAVRIPVFPTDGHQLQHRHFIYRVFRAQADWTLTHTSHIDTEQSTIEASIALDGVTQTDSLIR